MMAITPMFSPYVVVGTDPINPDNIVEKLSANNERCNPGSSIRFLPTTSPVTIWCPICSDAITNNTGIIIRMASILNFGAWKLGIEIKLASSTGEKSTIPTATAVKYPATTAIRIGITLKNFLKHTLPITATPSVTANTITLLGLITSSSSPAVLAADEDSSSPIRATTGPMAADGSTISIHFVPNFLMIRASKHPQNPTATNPPHAYG